MIKKIIKVAAVLLVGGLLIGSSNYLIRDITQASISEPLFSSKAENLKDKVAEDVKKDLKDNLRVLCSYANVSSENCEIKSLKNKLSEGKIENYSEIKARVAGSSNLVLLEKTEDIAEKIEKSKSFSGIVANILLYAEEHSIIAIEQAWVSTISDRFIHSCKGDSIPPEKCFDNFKGKLNKIYNEEFKVNKHKVGEKPECGIKRLEYFSKQIYSSEYNQTLLKFFNGMRRYVYSKSKKGGVLSFQYENKNITTTDLCDKVLKIPYTSLRIISELTGTIMVSAVHLGIRTTETKKLTTRITKRYNLTEVSK